MKVEFGVWNAVAFESERPLPNGGLVEMLLLGIDSAVWHILEGFRTEFFPGEPPFLKWDTTPER